MSKLTKIQRVRMSVECVENLAQLKKYGIRKSDFIRSAINEKFERDLPKILSDQRKKENLKYCPF